METTPTTPTLAAVRLARAQRDARIRRLRPAAAIAAVLTATIALRQGPGPGLRGESLGVFLALAGVLAGGLGALAVRRDQRVLLTVSFALLLTGSGGLIWLQSKGGAGTLGFMIAAIAIMRLGLERRWRIAAGAALSVISLAMVIAAAVVQNHARAPTVPSLVLSVLPWAVIAVSLLAHRLNDDSYQIERLLIDLEHAQQGEIRAVALAERQRLAREMHDVLAHSLSALALQLEGARLLAIEEGAGARLTGTIERTHHLAKSGLTEARRAIGMLRDEELPGPERLAALMAEFERDSGVSCEFEVAGEQRDLDPQARLALYRVAQEALTNIRKHARPDRVEVHLDYEPGGTRLTVADFGRERSPAPSMAGAAAVGRAAVTGDGAAGDGAAGGGAAGDGGADSGYGLAGMRERAELLGGRLVAGPTPQGFRVELWVPA
jgi:signal transduction histidine kinase